MFYEVENMIAAGNGGSAADAEHIIGELMKGFKLQRNTYFYIESIETA